MEGQREMLEVQIYEIESREKNSTVYRRQTNVGPFFMAPDASRIIQEKKLQLDNLNGEAN